MSKRKIWNVNEKKHYKMYKNGKQWFFAGMGIVAGLFGAGSTTIASADETPRGANLDLSKSKNLLATKTSATIPGSTSAANSQSTNSTHNSVTNSTSAAKQNAQTSASQAASKAGSASLSASLKAAQDASASQQKASQSQAAAKAASQQKASEKTVKQSTTSSTKAKPASQTSTKGSQAASTTKQDTASANQAKSASQGSQSKTDPQSKASTDASNNQSSQSLSAVKSATDSAKQSRSLEAAKQSLSISQSMVASMSKSTEKITSDSNDPEAPILHEDAYYDDADMDHPSSLIPAKDDWRDNDDVFTIAEPPKIPGYILDMTKTEIAFAMSGAHQPSNQARLDYENAFTAYAKTAGSIADLNAWIKNSDFYKKYLTGTDPESQIDAIQIAWYFTKHDSELNLEGHDVETSVGNPLEPKDAVVSITNADGSHPNLDEDLPGLTWIGYINWNQHGDYDVMLSYYDANSLQTVTTQITVHVTSLINLDGKDGTTYEGYPKDIGDFVKDTILNGKGEHVDIADADLSWDMREDNWNHAKDYPITIRFKDTTGEIIETQVTIHVLKNQSEISGKDATYTVGQGPHLTVDDLQPSGRNADGSLASGFEADFSHVDWDTAGKYTVEISFTDAVTKGKVSTTVTVTVDDNYGSMSTSASMSNKNDDDSRSASISDKNDSESTST